MSLAVFVHGSASTFTPMLAVLLMLPILMVFAPQPIRRNKRVIVGLLVLLAAVIGAPVYAAVCNICAVCNGPYWWMFVECWVI